MGTGRRLLLLRRDGLLERRAGRELRRLRGFDLDFLARTRVDACAGSAFDDGELAEARDAHLVALLERPRDRVQQRLDRPRGIRLREAAVRRYGLNQLGLVHCGSIPFVRGDVTGEAQGTLPASCPGSSDPWDRRRA